MILQHWFDILFPPRVDEITLRGISNDEFLALVAPRLVSETRPETIVLLSFDNPFVRAAIHEAKYRGNERAFELLALVLAEYLRDCDDIGRTTSYIVPVPLGKKRQKERGFNQVEEIVRSAMRKCEIKVGTNVLVRTHETISQVSLPRHKREENMRSAFSALHQADPTCSYIVVDDVLTTGATLQAAINALKGAGAEHIIPLALAH